MKTRTGYKFVNDELKISANFLTLGSSWIYMFLLIALTGGIEGFTIWMQEKAPFSLFIGGFLVFMFFWSIHNIEKCIRGM